MRLLGGAGEGLSQSRDSQIPTCIPEVFGLHVARSRVDFTECKKGGFQPHTRQHSYSSKSHYGRITTLHRVSALYLDISPGNIKNMSSIKSNDICFKCSFLFSLFFSSWKIEYMLLCGGRDLSCLHVSNTHKSVWGRWGGRGRKCTHLGWLPRNLLSLSSAAASSS